MSKQISKSSKRTEKYKVISLKKLSEASGIDYAKLYNALSGRYNSLSVNEKTALCNAAYEELDDFFKFLGFQMKLTRLSVAERSQLERAQIKG